MEPVTEKERLREKMRLNKIQSKQGMESGDVGFLKHWISDFEAILIKPIKISTLKIAIIWEFTHQ